MFTPNQNQALIYKNITAPLTKFLFALAFTTTSPLTFIGAAVVDHFSKKWEDDAKKNVDARIKKLADEIVRDLEPLFAQDTTSVNLEAVAIEVGKTIEGTLDIALIIGANLDATRLENELKRARPEQVAQWDEADKALYFRVLKELTPRVVALAPELKDFHQKTFSEILEQLDVIQDIVEGFQSDVPLRRFRSELAHLQALSDNLDEMELFGAALPPGQNRHPLLKVAYVSLNLKFNSRSQDGFHDEESNRPQNISAEYLFDRVFNMGGRLLITGDAGSGKSTLTRWLALEASRTQLGFDTHSTTQSPRSNRLINPRRDRFRSLENLQDQESLDLDLRSPWERDFVWRERVPFLVRLRECKEGQLPSLPSIPETLVNALGPGEPGWVENVLGEGRGLLIFDGIDEIPKNHREHFRKQVEGFLKRFPGTPVLMTARPAAVEDWKDWLEPLKFQKAEINPMSLDERILLIQRWHDAVRTARIQSKSDSKEIQKITKAEGKLLDELADDSRLARLASYPLLCAVICAVHLWKGAEPLRGYWQMSELCCELLLHVRDLEAGVKTQEFPVCYRDLLYPDKRMIAQNVAIKMVEGRFRSAMTTDEAIAAVGPVLSYIPNRRSFEAGTVMETMLERSGMLREPQKGEVEFIHNLFKEFLIADHLITERKIEELKARCADTDWQEVIVFAAANISNLHLASTLIETILVSDDHASRVLALRCKEVAKFIGEDLEDKLEAVARSVFPPETEKQAEAIATLGNTYVKHLEFHNDLTPEQARCAVLALRGINTRYARKSAQTFAEDERVFETLIRVISPLYIPKCVESLTQRSARTEEGEYFSEPWRSQIRKLEPLNEDESRFKDDPRFQKFNLSRTEVTDLTPLQHLPQLEWLDLTEAPVSDLKPLGVLTQLKTLGLGETKVNEINPLGTLRQLEWLSLHKTSVNDVSALQPLTQLKALHLGETRVSDITFIEKLTQLETLDLDDTKVS